jgi:phospholipid N-methyltransferase
MTITQGNDQFYPTPPALAEKMLEGLDMNYVSTVLEPSAGKGDLVTAIARKNQMAYRNREIDVDCCEIDPYLRQILQYNFSDEKKQEIGAAQGYHTREYDLIDHTKLHVVHDDFLTYSSMKHYDLILMNPPFQDGAKHLLKALHMQRDGGLVICLLNAETLRNPYTDMRQDLVRMLQELNAEITFVDDAFRDAERSASVDAAIVRVHIQEAEHESEFWSRMKKAITESDPQPDPELKALVAGDYIDQAITLYNTEVAATMEFVKEYRALVPYIYTDLSPQDKYRAPILTLTVSGDSGASGFDQQRYMRTVRLKYWRALFKNEKFVGRLTSNLRERYEKQVDRMADYEFSAFNIKQIMIEMNAEMTQGVEDSIMGLFDKLTIEHSWFPECKNNRHYYNGWATNKAHKIGKKCIVPENMFRDSWGYGSDYLDTFKAYKVLSDLEKSFDYLGGEGPEGYDLNARLECAKQSGQTRNIQLKYFAIDIFKKGTTHIKFYPETMKLVDRLNIYASQKKGWLPPRYGKARYKDMNDMEQMVVDSFHGNDTKGSGAKAYAEVMANAAFYLTEPTQKLPALMAAT